MNLKKHFVVLGLITAAVLSLVIATPVKQVKHADCRHTSLLSESYNEEYYKYC